MSCAIVPPTSTSTTATAATAATERSMNGRTCFAARTGTRSASSIPISSGTSWNPASVVRNCERHMPFAGRWKDERGRNRDRDERQSRQDERERDSKTEAAAHFAPSGLRQERGTGRDGHQKKTDRDITTFARRA